jgi:hypothetical protein
MLGSGVSTTTVCLDVLCVQGRGVVLGHQAQGVRIRFEHVPCALFGQGVQILVKWNI